jgi:hypothetical protein
MRTTLLILAFSLLLGACATQQGTQTKPYPEPEDTATVIAEMAATREQAAADNRLVMYVLGANWCHDSQDFAKLLATPLVESSVGAHYQVQYVNVGYLQHIREYVDLYDVPVIYATPTVLVVDPVSNSLLNRDSLDYWRSASTQEAQQVVDYFAQFQPGKPVYSPTDITGNLATALASINQYERHQAERIYGAYNQLSPMLKSMEQGEPAADFGEKWGNLAAMRAALPVDLAALRASAHRQAEAGVTDIELEFPHYTLFTD